MSTVLHNINVKLRSYNSNLLDKATSSFIESVKQGGGTVCGPIPMPKKIEKFTVTRSPHVDKKSMEHFSNSENNIKPKRPIKKLNIELIKKVLMETKEIQEKKKEHK